MAATMWDEVPTSGKSLGRPGSRPVPMPMGQGEETEEKEESEHSPRIQENDPATRSKDRANYGVYQRPVEALFGHMTPDFRIIRIW